MVLFYTVIVINHLFLPEGDIMQGKKNLAAGFLFLTGFMVLIYLRDFAPGKE